MWRHWRRMMITGQSWATNLRILTSVLALVLMVCANFATAETLTDGPYVFHGAAGSEAHWVCEGARVVLPVERDRQVKSACGAFQSLTLDASHSNAPDVLAQSRRWAAISDIHGQLDLLRRLLSAQGITDGAGHWTWGRSVLVITGDVLDRGPQQLDALWAIYRLSQEAREAGGSVQYLLGNHEVMVMAGDLRYLHPKYVEVSALLGRPYDQLLGADSALGDWLRHRATALKLGDTLFVHGGLHPDFAKSEVDLSALNAKFRRRLGVSRADLQQDAEGEWLLGSDGPTWYRGYFEPATATAADIDALLKAAKVKRMVVGHTTQDQITSLFGGRVIGIDAGIKNGLSGEILIFDKGKLWRGRLDGSRVPL